MIFSREFPCCPVTVTEITTKYIFAFNILQSNGLWYFQLGYCEALSSLSKSYPVPSWPVCWSCDVHAITRSPSPTGKTGFTGHVFHSTSSPNEPLVSSILCNNGGGSLSFVVELITSSWLTFNLHSHEDALLVGPSSRHLGSPGSLLRLARWVTDLYIG